MATAIVTKYSVANTVPLPGQLLDGELAYSFPSGNLFIGANGTYETIGGKHYIDIIDSRSNTSSPETLVIRTPTSDIISRTFTSTETSSPGFIGNLRGIADSANSIFTPVIINLSGDAIGNVETNFDSSSGNVEISVALSNTTVTPGAYGNSTTIPVITVDEKGRVTNLQNVSIDIISQDAFEQANAAANLAQAAYDAANSSTPSFNQSSFEQANAAFEFANLLSTYANTPSSIANIALDLALDAFRYANAAFNVANSDNFTGTTANAAFDSSNSASVYANAAFTQANTSFEFANSALILVAQSSNSIVNIQSIAANAEIVAFSAADRVNSAYLHANSSFDTANLKLNTSGGTITGNLLISGNLIVAGNVSYIATNHLNIGDNIITLNADLGQSATPTENSGIEVERGNQPNTS